MALPNDKRSLQDRLSRVATRMAQKFGNGVFNGVTVGAGVTAGIPVSVLINRIAGKKVLLDSIGNENASALSFSLVDLGLGITATTGEHLVAQTYISSQLPTGFYGSPAPLIMLAKLKAGTDSLDIHVVGDSNAGYGGSTFIPGGYAGGLARGLIEGCCASMYATAIWPTGICQDAIGATDNYGAFQGGYRNNSTLTKSGKLPNSGGNTWGIGKDAPEDVKSFFNVFGSNLGYGSPGGSGTPIVRSTFSWAYKEGATYNSNEENFIYSYDPLVNGTQYGIKTTNALTYRVVHSLLPGNGASSASVVLYFGGASASPGYCAAGNNMKTYAFSDNKFYTSNSGFTYYPPSSASNRLGARYSAWAGVNGATAKTVSKLTWPADSSRIGVTLAYGWGAKQSGFTMTYGPYAIYLESVHSNSKGWAITPVTYISGATTGGIADAFINTLGATTGSYDNSALKTVLQETRERQIEAGGSGNVLVWLNSGVNDKSILTEATAASVYKDQIKNIISSYKSVWKNLNYPDNDIAFMVTTTHPIDNNDDSLDTIRTKGKEYANTTPDANNPYDPYYNVMYINFEEVGITYGTLLNGNSFNTNKTFYDSGGNSHMTYGSTGGYDYVSEVIMKKCLRYTVSY